MPVSRPIAAAALAGLLSLAALPAAAQSSTSVDIMNAEGESLGTLELTDTPKGVLIAGELTGLPEGEHGFHIHETGACEPPFESAGGHFNPTGASHGYLSDNGPHAGDMPNIHVGEGGSINIAVFNSFVRLEEGDSALADDDGSAIMIHEGADDYASDPSGDAGSRIACGVIEAAQ